MKVSIVICTYNRKEQLDRGLRTILDQDVLPDEIIIVDDGSTDGTQDLIEPIWHTKISMRYIYIDHTEPRISCIPRNVGIKQATGDVIIFTEPEGLQVGNTIEQLLKKMEEYPDNTILASQVWTMGEKIQKNLPEECFRDPHKIITHEYAVLTDSHRPHNDQAPDSDWAITGEKHCNAGVLFATKKEWLLKVGGFDESFEGHGFDDFDLFNRLALIGHGVVKFSDIAVIHQWHDKSFYKYNIYDAAERNGKISEDNIHRGIYEVNKDKEWGIK